MTLQQNVFLKMSLILSSNEAFGEKKQIIPMVRLI